MMLELICELLVLVDWLLWNYMFGGSYNFGIVLYNGGMLYIDDGCLVFGCFDEIVCNLCEIVLMIYFNVLKGWEELIVVFECDVELCDMFFLCVKLYFFGGVGLL